MDGKGTRYELLVGTFNRLATKHGEIVALISRPIYNGKPVIVTEKGALRSYEMSKAHNEQMPYHLKWFSSQEMALRQQARAAIQEAKIHHGIPLDTPPVSETPPAPHSTNAFKSANDEVHDLIP